MSEFIVKCLHQGGISVHSFIDAQGKNFWPLPENGNPGQWKGPVAGELKPHQNGLHLTKKDHFIEWLTGSHYLAETDGETVEGQDCVIARRARLIERLPVNAAGLDLFCSNWVNMIPSILDALNVYPKITIDAKLCATKLSESGIHNSNASFGNSIEYKNIRQSAMRIGYDIYQSLEYNYCTRTSRMCLDTLVGINSLALKKANSIQFAKYVSYNTAQAISLLHENLIHFERLTSIGYNHSEEVASMKNFFADNDFDVSEYGNIYQSVRRVQNRELIPSLGF